MADPVEINAPITLPPAITITAPITLGYKGDKGDKGDTGPTGPPGTTDYTQLVNVPATFPPSAHTHVSADITDATDDAAAQPGKVLRSSGSGSLSLTALNATSLSAGSASITSLSLGSALSITNGGTGATTVDGARAALGAVGLAGNETIAGNKTLTGQLELTGQAATNATSAMTRGLVDTRYPKVAAWKSVNQTLSTAGYNIITYETKELDTHNCFDGTKFTVPFDCSVLVTGTLYHTGSAGVNGLAIYRHTGSGIGTEIRRLWTYSNGTNTVTGFAGVVRLTAGQQIQIVYYNQNGSGPLPANQNVQRVEFTVIP